MEESLKLSSELLCGGSGVNDWWLVLVISSTGRQVALQGPPALVAVSSPLLLHKLTFSKASNLKGVCGLAEELVGGFEGMVFVIKFGFDKTKAPGWHRVFSVICFYYLLCHLHWLFYSISLGLQQWHGMSQPAIFQHC